MIRSRNRGGRIADEPPGKTVDTKDTRLPVVVGGKTKRENSMMIIG